MPNSRTSHQSEVSIEQRAANRTKVNWKARLRNSQGHMMDHRTDDISISGVGLLGDHPLIPNSIMQLALQVPQMHQPGVFEVITGQVSIVFHVLKGDQFRTGVKWIDLPESHKALIATWIEQSPPIVLD